MSGYRKVPNFIRDQIQACTSDTFYVGKSREYSRAAISGGTLEHLNVSWGEDGLKYPAEPIVPPPERGRWSRYNVDGWVKIRRDLPKFEKTVGVWETPNWGDPSKGTHTYYSTRKVWQRETWYGQRLAIRLEVQDPVGDLVRIGFIVDRVFDRAAIEERDLHLACSLLRENLGSHAAIIPTDIPVAEWLNRQRVNWEILPVDDQGPRPFAEIVQRLKADPDSPRIKRMGERYDKVFAMGPTDVIVGDGEFSRYFGFKFREDLVALECLDYGNALYLMYEDWPILSQRTRVDLLSDTSAKYERIIHREGWEGRLASYLRANGHDFGTEK